MEEGEHGEVALRGQSAGRKMLPREPKRAARSCAYLWEQEHGIAICAKRRSEPRKSLKAIRRMSGDREA